VGASPEPLCEGVEGERGEEQYQGACDREDLQRVQPRQAREDRRHRVEAGRVDQVLLAGALRHDHVRHHRVRVVVQPPDKRPVVRHDPCVPPHEHRHHHPQEQPPQQPPARPPPFVRLHRSFQGPFARPGEPGPRQGVDGAGEGEQQRGRDGELLDGPARHADVRAPALARGCEPQGLGVLEVRDQDEHQRQADRHERQGARRGRGRSHRLHGLLRSPAEGAGEAPVQEGARCQHHQRGGDRHGERHAETQEAGGDEGHRRDQCQRESHRVGEPLGQVRPVARARHEQQGPEPPRQDVDEGENGERHQQLRDHDCPPPFPGVKPARAPCSPNSLFI